ncbi:MAG: homoserine kinase, partial [Gammaproteobacteria bacterium]|nr:homoserine kinase [Gammaproteobacteria bacterium]
MADSVTAFAPASIGNVAVGFDMLGLALAGAGDRVAVRKTAEPGITIAEVRGIDGELHPYLSTDPEHNTASIAAKALWDDHGDGRGLELKVYKGVPLQSGMGSSAASAVAAAFAANQLLDTPLPTQQLLTYALAGEKYASGGLHADNVAPSLLGGMVFCPLALLPDMISLPVPRGVSAVLLHPELQVNTAQARRGLAKSYSMQQWLEQQAYFGGFIAACAASDIDLIRRTLKDVIIEPQRAAAVAC